jgi:two-component system invasion response regulator UvrY
MNISVFIVDDHKLIVDAWSRLLRDYEQIDLCGTASTLKEAKNAIQALRPDIVLMDIILNEDSGIELTGEITKTLPKTKIIGLSIHNDMAIVRQMLKKGASGYLTKNIDANELVHAIESVHQGNTYVCREITSREFFENISNSVTEKLITSKEMNVISLIIKGHTSKEISEKLGIAKRTVDTHRYNIMKKLKLSNVTQLVAWAKNKGIG